jgi:hypothetical protein
MGKNKNAGKPRNYALECGVYRFGKGKMYHKKAIYKFNKKAAPVKVRLAFYVFNLRIFFSLCPVFFFSI